MIIIKDRPALMGNRLWAFSPFIVESLLSGNRIIVLYFGDYAHYFEDLKCFHSVHIVQMDNTPYYYALRLLWRILQWLPSSFLRIFRVYAERFQEPDPHWTDEIRGDKRNIVFMSGWSNAKPFKNLVPHREIVTKLFAPKREAVAKVDSFLKARRGECDVVVAVHIRRGNYIDFVGGAYYWEDSAYVGYMRQILLAPRFKDQRVGFLLCSDQPVDVAAYGEFRAFQIPKASGIEDCYAMSRCDYIMGPPSTFAMWASFNGQVPLRILKYAVGPIDLSEFVPIVAQDRFADGSVFEHVGGVPLCP